MPANLQRAIETALAQEIDPDNLRDFATSIRASYPDAAAALERRANGILLPRGAASASLHIHPTFRAQA
jgi:hypothetical protein